MPWQGRRRGRMRCFCECIAALGSIQTPALAFALERCTFNLSLLSAVLDKRRIATAVTSMAHRRLLFVSFSSWLGC